LLLCCGDGSTDLHACVEYAEAEQPEYLRRIVNQFPKYNRFVLQYLMQFCKQVVEHAAVTKMSAQNIAIVLGPILVADKVQTLDMAKHSLVFGIITAMVQEYDTIFQACAHSRSHSLTLTRNHLTAQ
jgi:hypothetical protein